MATGTIRQSNAGMNMQTLGAAVTPDDLKSYPIGYYRVNGNTNFPTGYRYVIAHVEKAGDFGSITLYNFSNLGSSVFARRSFYVSTLAWIDADWLHVIPSDYVSNYTWTFNGMTFNAQKAGRVVTVTCDGQRGTDPIPASGFLTAVSYPSEIAPASDFNVALVLASVGSSNYTAWVRMYAAGTMTIGYACPEFPTTVYTRISFTYISAA